MKITSTRGESTTVVEIDPTELVSIGTIIHAAARSLESILRFKGSVIPVRAPATDVADDDPDDTDGEEHHDEDGSVRVVVPFRTSDLGWVAAPEKPAPEKPATSPTVPRITAGVPYLPLTPREQLARGEWAASHEDVGQHDTWKYVVQYALWRNENPDAPLPRSWSGRSADHAPLFPLHPQVCEAMRRLHPWRLVAAALGADSPHDAMQSGHGRAKMESLLTRHIAAAKAEAQAIYDRCLAVEQAGGPRSPYASPADAEAQYVIFPCDPADEAWTSWPNLYPIPAGEPDYE